MVLNLKMKSWKNCNKRSRTVMIEWQFVVFAIGCFVGWIDVMDFDKIVKSKSGTRFKLMLLKMVHQGS